MPAKRTISSRPNSAAETLPDGPVTPGYLVDFISGRLVKETPEEVKAVQVFSQSLVEEYGYPKSHIQTRPQWRVKARPSDTVKEYPVDIAVFSGATHQDENIEIIVECKKPNREDGRSQLEDYLRFSRATIGVWFNGDQRLYLHKVEQGGRVLFNELPNIPRFGQRLEDIGKFKRKDLKPAASLKPVFRAIRNYLAANAVGTSRDEVIAQQLINLIFCKIYDERFTRPEEIVKFRAGFGEDTAKVAQRVRGLFAHVKSQYKDVIDAADDITLSDKLVSYVVGELQNYSLMESSRDAVAEAFETFIGQALKGPQGQFFTPRNVVTMIVDILNPGPQDRIIDPACGSGGFLVESLRHVWREVERQGTELAWPKHEIDAEKQSVALKNFHGIDKDSFLVKVAKAYMAILGDGRGGIHCENSLEHVPNWKPQTQIDVALRSFDIVITNPPFGKKLSIDQREILSAYELGHKWRQSKSGEWTKEGVYDKQPPQLLFVERCFDLLKPGGRLGIVLLESIFGMPKYRYVVDFIRKNSRILALITLPEDLFQPYTHAKTCVLVCEKGAPQEDYPIFMCDVKWCGHDSRGNPTWRINEEGKKELLDEVPLVAGLYHKGPTI